MAKNGSVLSTATFTRSGGVGAGITDQVADDKVLAQLSDGATLVLQALHRTWPPLVRFGSALAAELGHPVQINAYVTPPQNQGFSAHYDTHDVFVLQVAGTKALDRSTGRSSTTRCPSRPGTSTRPRSPPERPKSRSSTRFSHRVTRSTCRAATCIPRSPRARSPSI